MGKGQNTRKQHTQESGEVSPSPAGGHIAAMNRHESMTIAKMINKRSTTLEWSVTKYFYGGLKLVLWNQPQPRFNLDLHLFIPNDIVSTKFYDKRDDFDFEIANVPF